MPRQRSRAVSGEKGSVTNSGTARRGVLFAFLSLAAAGPAFGWGCEGHQAIALIARAHLSAPAAAVVDDLLRQYPIDPSLDRFCKDRPADPMADASTWADDARNIEKTGAWHYIDIPLSVTQARPDVSAWCAPIGPLTAGRERSGCIVDAIAYERGILRAESRPGAERAKALRYLIHLVGDLHQPLHTTDNNDRGGNCTAMRFFGEDRLANLHAIWDYKLIQRELDRDQETPPQFAAALDRRFATHWNEWGQAAADVMAWTWEAHAIAGNVAYADLRPRIPVEQPNPRDECDVERKKVADLRIEIGAEYFDQTEPVIEEQLAKAGYRLAALLNQTFGE